MGSGALSYKVCSITVAMYSPIIAVVESMNLHWYFSGLFSTDQRMIHVNERYLTSHFQLWKETF